MSEFSIKIDIISEQSENLKQCSSTLKEINQKIEEIRSNLTIDEGFVQLIHECEIVISNQENQLSNLSSALKEIVEKYVATENKLTGHETESKDDHDTQSNGASGKTNPPYDLIRKGRDNLVEEY